MKWMRVEGVETRKVKGTRKHDKWKRGEGKETEGKRIGKDRKEELKM